MKRGFTFIELMLASGLGVILFAATAVALFSVFRLMRESSAEMELALKMRAMREHLLYNVKTTSDKVYMGLAEIAHLKSTNEVNVAVSVYGIAATVSYTNVLTGVKGSEYLPYFDHITYASDPNDGTRAKRGALKSGEKLLYAYLVTEVTNNLFGAGATVLRYRERVVIPLDTNQTKATGTWGPFENNEDFYSY